MLFPASCKEGSIGEKNIGQPVVRNIIFFIGDGMGVNQVAAAIENADYVMNFEKADYSGLCKTYPISNKITDSAASGTAMATGKKTANGVIGLDTSGVVLKNMVEYAEEDGLSTGLISTSSITHATPAAFIAHQPNRNMYEAIAADFLKTDIDLFIGGGFNNFAVRSDEINLIDSLINRGYEVDTTLEAVKTSTSERIAGLLAPNHLPPATSGRGNMLAEATQKALEALNKNEKGFFLMVEASQIDWGGHASDIDYVLGETYDLDKSIGVALEFAKKNPGTLIVVTADHETGGLTLPAKNGDYSKTEAMFATGGHTSVLVPVFSYGPGAELFSGILDNTDFVPKFLNLLGIAK